MSESAWEEMTCLFAPSFEGSRHNALADAIHQARYVSAIWQRIIAGNQVLQKLMQN
ncbi:3'-5' exoribonuclease domain-containing protein [Klebsiella variicola]|uniref:3'-5' exoribonuclease domain-containing protein n=1 Tax=Klebsiella variicola TaxID=244366 RepID=UPI003EDAB03E